MSTPTLPELKYWIDPQWKTEDEDYARRWIVVLIVRHPATRATIRVGQERYGPNKDGDMDRAKALLIERANALVVS